MSPRPYDMGRRRAGSDATRVRILEAARAILAGAGDLDDFSMEAVARKAGVSRMTVYYQFRSRTGLFDALADHLAERGGMAGIARAFTAATAEAAITQFIETFVRFWSSDPAALRRMRALGIVFPELLRGPRDRDAWRREAAGRLLARFGAGASRGSALPPPAVADLLAALTSFETYDALSRGGRSEKEIVELLVRAMETLRARGSVIRGRSRARTVPTE